MNTKTAKFIKMVDVLDGGSWKGDARLYALSEPIDYFTMGPNTRRSVAAGTTKFVVVVADGRKGLNGSIEAYTAIFPVTREGDSINGNTADFCHYEIGWVDHVHALNHLGFEVLGGETIVDTDKLLQTAQSELGFEDSAMPTDLAQLLAEIEAGDGFDDSDEEETERTGTEG